MAGLARIQQRFTTALIGTLAALVGFARGGTDKQATERRRLQLWASVKQAYLKESL